MEKTIEIGEIKIRLASNAATPLRYKMQFHTDYFADLMKLAKALETGTEEEFNFDNVSWEQLSMLNLTLLYNFVGSMPKLRTIQFQTLWIGWIVWKVCQLKTLPVNYKI